MTRGCRLGKPDQDVREQASRDRDTPSIYYAPVALSTFHPLLKNNEYNKATVTRIASSPSNAAGGAYPRDFWHVIFPL